MLQSDRCEAGFDLETEEIQPSFTYSYANQSILVKLRTMDIDGMNNFRDLGGYPTRDGRHVRWGLLFRSDQIYNASPKGLVELKELGIKTIIDYRSNHEIAKYPNPDMGKEIRSYQLDPNAHTAELSAQFTSDKENEDITLIKSIVLESQRGTLVNQYDMVIEQYRNFVHKADAQSAFKEYLQLLANKENIPLVQHCRGGKDRTGFGAMLLLAVLGVDEENIVYDYMITGQNRQERNIYKMEQYRKHTQDAKVLDYLYSLIDTKEVFIQTSLEAILEEYASVANYVVQVLGLKQELIDKLKAMYLE